MVCITASHTPGRCRSGCQKVLTGVVYRKAGVIAQRAGARFMRSTPVVILRRLRAHLRRTRPALLQYGRAYLPRRPDDVVRQLSGFQGGRVFLRACPVKALTAAVGGRAAATSSRWSGLQPVTLTLGAARPEHYAQNRRSWLEVNGYGHLQPA